MVIPKYFEGEVIRDCHNRYGHIGTQKVVIALEEHVYMKELYKKRGSDDTPIKSTKKQENIFGYLWTVP